MEGGHYGVAEDRPVLAQEPRVLSAEEALQHVAHPLLPDVEPRAGRHRRRSAKSGPEPSPFQHVLARPQAPSTPAQGAVPPPRRPRARGGAREGSGVDRDMNPGLHLHLQPPLVARVVVVSVIRQGRVGAVPHDRFPLRPPSGRQRPQGPPQRPTPVFSTDLRAPTRPQSLWPYEGRARSGDTSPQRGVEPLVHVPRGPESLSRPQRRGAAHSAPLPQGPHGRRTRKRGHAGGRACERRPLPGAPRPRPTVAPACPLPRPPLAPPACLRRPTFRAPQRGLLRQRAAADDHEGAEEDARRLCGHGRRPCPPRSPLNRFVLAEAPRTDTRT